MSIYIKAGSVTNAQRARAVLMKNGIKSYLQRLENPGPGDGCGYVLKTEERNKDVAQILEESGVRILGVDYR